MEQYNWNIEEILSSDISSDAKKILLSEYKKELLETDPSVIKKVSFKSFKENVFQNNEYLKTINEEVYRAVSSAHNYYSLKSSTRFIFPEMDLSEENLINPIRCMIESLGNKELLSSFEELVNKNNHFLRISKKSQENPISGYVSGRCICSNGKNYISFYKNGTLEDISILAHEIGHALFKNAYKNINPFFQTLYTEAEAYLIELLMDEFLINYYNLNEGLIFKANRLNKVAIRSWNLEFQKILARQIGRNPNLAKLNKKVGESIDYQLDDEELESLLSTSFITNYRIVSSYLIALETLNKIKDDPEKGLRDFKDLLTSTENTDPDLLIVKNNYLFTFDYQLFKKECQKTLEIKRTVM